MILDMSAILAVVLGEPEAEQVLAAIDHAPSVGMGAPTLVELAAVMEHRAQPEVWRRVEKLLELWEVATVPFDAHHAEVAARAYRDYGKHGPHRAKLNFGDCLSYATATVAGQPLAFVGDDLGHTDIEPAIGSATS